jgi:hypothetical protein
MLDIDRNAMLVLWNPFVLPKSPDLDTEGPVAQRSLQVYVVTPSHVLQMQVLEKCGELRNTLVCDISKDLRDYGINT